MFLQNGVSENYTGRPGFAVDVVKPNAKQPCRRMAGDLLCELRWAATCSLSDSLTQFLQHCRRKEESTRMQLLLEIEHGLLAHTDKALLWPVEIDDDRHHQRDC
jgi:hypothetical protein